MKRVIILFSLSLVVSLGGWAQTSTNTSKKSSTTTTTTTTTTSAKATTVLGTVSSSGKTFVADKTKKTWTIDNPDAVKAHEGHHVSLNAVENAAADTLHVNSAKMVKSQTGNKS
jgi:hypothetical protein